MNDQKAGRHAFSHYIDKLQAGGSHTFLKSTALTALNYSPKSFERAARRLIKQKRLLSIKPGFFIIVPPECQAQGGLSPAWFIEDLMTYLKLPYYAGLHSAVALYNGENNADQPFQVMTSSIMSRVHKQNVEIRFLKNQYTVKTPFNVLKTEAGTTLLVSTPEATAFDLVKFYKSSKSFTAVAVAISKLIPHLKEAALVEMAKQGLYEWPIIQRLSYLLSLEGVKGEALAKPLAEWAAAEKPRYVPLVPHKTYEEDEKVSRFRLFINESIAIG